MDKSELQSRLADLHVASFGWALSCCQGRRAMAEDVLQNAYLKVLDGRAEFGGKSEFKTWLFGVVRNSAREEGRREKLRKLGMLRFVPEPEPQRNPSEQSEFSETRAQLLQLLEKLSGRQREILHLVFYQDLTVEAAAQVMGVSLGSARTHYQRGKDKMRTLLEQARQDG
ncbi:MAG: RNA polymerase sigma factor [Verrucomicrobiales bacterium]